MKITKSQCIMDISLQTEIAPTVSFLAVNDDNVSYRWIQLTREDWDNLGSPTRITVTVVPGDTLNETKVDD